MQTRLTVHAESLTVQRLLAENAELRARLAQAEEALRALRRGEVDAPVVDGAAGTPEDTVQEGFVQRVTAEMTVRTQAEALRTQLAAIVEHSNDGIFSRTLDGTILSWNAGAEKMLGYTAAEAIGKPATFNLPPGRSPNLAENNERMRRGEAVTRESDRMTRDGRVLTVLNSYSPIRDAAGNLTGVSVILRDVTALKRAEQALRENADLFAKIIEQAPGGVYVVDAQFRLEHINAEALPVFASVEPLIGRDFDEVMQIIWGPEVGPQCANIFRHTLATGERYVSRGLLFSGRDGAGADADGITRSRPAQG